VTPIPIVLYGASGRMGRAVRASIVEFPETRLTLCVARTAPDARGESDFPWMTPDELVARGAQAAPADAVVIDVSLAAGTAPLLDWLEASPRALVSATTGVGTDEKRRIEALARRAPVLRSMNLSLGSAAACAMFRALPEGAREAFEIDVVEHHHAAKRDAPSGTARLWASHLAPSADAVDAHPDVTRPRAPGTVRLHSIRSGTVPGTHRAILAGAGETLEIVHTVTDRAVFARGAIRAARFLAGKPPGLYTLEQMLEHP
jgi:4-hydroxy-tetrahydrodipicolinate reductase